MSREQDREPSKGNPIPITLKVLASSSFQPQKIPRFVLAQFITIPYYKTVTTKGNQQKYQSLSDVADG